MGRVGYLADVLEGGGMVEVAQEGPDQTPLHRHAPSEQVPIDVFFVLGYIFRGLFSFGFGIYYLVSLKKKLGVVSFLASFFMFLFKLFLSKPCPLQSLGQAAEPRHMAEAGGQVT